VPTFQEAANAPQLIARIAAVCSAANIAPELIIVDDDSRDGIDHIAPRAAPWARVIVRTGQRGLASAALLGMHSAAHDTIIVMDADLSHPPEAIPALLAALDSGAEIAVASRFAPGGSTDAEWTPARRVNSAIATLLARPFTRLRDPMSGFFALSTPVLRRAGHLDPIGYKIALEIIVRARCTRIAEVPIHFTERRAGHSKLSIRVRLEYLRHLLRLAIFRLRGPRQRTDQA
jgi:dolichol-phosphate mannosyltransferase